MKYKNIYIGVLVIFIVALILVMGRGEQQEQTQQVSYRFAATIAPMADLVEQLSGEEVLQILPNGASPHTFQLTPQLRAQLEDVEVFYFIGEGLDNWVLDFADESKVTFVRLSSAVVLREYKEVGHHDEHEEEGGDHDHEGVDPHYWLSFTNAKALASAIKEDLEVHGVGGVSSRYTAWLEDLEAREKMARSLFEDKDIEIVTFHNAFSYLADDLGFEIVGVFEESAGKEPTPQDIAHLQELIDHNGITVVYTEPQLSSAALEATLSDLDLELRILDPLGGVEGRDSYADMLTYNITEIVR
jgi:zinc transport system substrate-binding protein